MIPAMEYVHYWQFWVFCVLPLPVYLAAGLWALYVVCGIVHWGTGALLPLLENLGHWCEAKFAALLRA